MASKEGKPNGNVEKLFRGEVKALIAKKKAKTQRREELRKRTGNKW